MFSLFQCLYLFSQMCVPMCNCHIFVSILRAGAARTVKGQDRRTLTPTSSILYHQMPLIDTEKMLCVNWSVNGTFLNHRAEILDCFYPQCSPLLTPFRMCFSEHPLSNRMFEAGAASRCRQHLGIKKNLNNKEGRSATSHSAATSEENLHRTASARVPPRQTFACTNIC